MADEIGENFCFRYENGNSQLRQKAYDYYRDNNPGSFNDWGYDNNTIIFLDTNVLLETYFLSKFERESIIAFLKNNKNRIVIASRVDTEYQKHRLDFISGYNKKLSQLSKDTKSLVESCLKSLNGDFIERIKVLAENHLLKFDFLEEYLKLNDILANIQSYAECLKEEREKITKSLLEFQTSVATALLPCNANVSSLYMNDELLQAVSQCTILGPLSTEELAFVKQKYEECLNLFDKKKIDEIGRYCYAFPGCGDKKKDDNEDRIKESDLVIYHEMLKYMKQFDTNAVFLTFDLKKGDWVPGYGHNDVFLHYVENQYIQTGHVIYIKSGDELPLMFGKIPVIVDNDSDNWICTSLEDVNLFDDIDSDEQSSENEDEKLLDEHSILECNGNNLRNKYRKINEERFLSELKTCSKWANEYGAGYIGKDYFIYGLLGKRKHFEFNQSRLVYNSLLNAGKLKEEIDKNGDKIIKLV